MNIIGIIMNIIDIPNSPASNQLIKRFPPPPIIGHRFRRACCHLCGSIGGVIYFHTESHYRTCSSCKEIIKKKSQNMIEKRKIRITRENNKILLSLCIRDCLHFDYLRSSHSGLARYMLGFI